MIKYAVKLLKNKFYALEIPEFVNVEHGQMVLVRTEKGEEAARVFLVPPPVAEKWKDKKPEFLPLVRIMNDRDLESLKELEAMEEEGYKNCLELIEKHKLNMNLIECKYTFDRKKVSFYYTAPERVDFRELLKDLTQVFKRVRIDLRHIGVRDETSLCQGNGLCGRPFCCCSFKRSFESINIKLARDQGMPITPGKISGTCGRLLCCLSYEYPNYMEAAKKMCPVGSGVMTPDGVGCVCSLHILNDKVSVKLEDGKIKDYGKDDIEMIDIDVNIDIDTPYKYSDGSEDAVDIKQLEDDRNSSTGNI